eukprot:3598662-Pleurochrysis_carterae.AAC.1
MSDAERATQMSSAGAVSSATPVAAVVLCRSMIRSNAGVLPPLGPSSALSSRARFASIDERDASASKLLSKQRFRSSSTYLRKVCTWTVTDR